MYIPGNSVCGWSTLPRLQSAVGSNPTHPRQLFKKVVLGIALFAFALACDLIAVYMNMTTCASETVNLHGEVHIGPSGTSIELSVSVLLDVERVLPEKSGGSHES